MTRQQRLTGTIWRVALGITLMFSGFVILAVLTVAVLLQGGIG